MKYLNIKKMKFYILSLTCTLLLSGCGSLGDNSNSGSASISSDSSDYFSNRDLEFSYDETQSVSILLQGTSAECNSDAVKISDSTVTITAEGTYVISGSLDDGMIIIDADKEDKLQLVLDGVAIHSETSAPIYIKTADKVFITLAIDSDNTLSNGGTFTQIDDNNIDAVLFSKEDLTLNGEGSLTIESPAGHGVVSKDDLVITGGDYSITAGSHGLTANDSLNITDATLNIIAEKDAIHCDTNIIVAGGTLEIACGDDGFHADENLTISGGIISISESYEGLEGHNIDITGGTISLVSSDDGLNAAGGNDQSGFGGMGGFRGNDMFASDSDSYINISGGTLYVNAGGDGIDSNGSLTVSGGETIVSGPTNNGNGALDYASEATISGGIFLAAGASGMASNFTSAENQGVMMVSTGSQKAGSTVELKNSDGETIFTWTADKAYSSVVLSCPDIQKGETYTLTIGSTIKEITMSELIYGSGSGFGGGGFGGGRGNGGRGQGGRGW